jgi:hypothetical protein
MTPDERRGYHWTWKVMRVGDMLEHLTRTIREDLGFDDGATLASIVLLRKAALYLQLELQDGGTKDGRHDRLENRYRVQRALEALAPPFDDVQLMRLRALQVAESSARMTRIPDDSDVDERLGRIADLEGLRPGEAERYRNFMLVDQPAVSAVMARSELMAIDDRFAALDPLVVMEEFSDAAAEANGGRLAGGEGRTGPARALARLCVMSGALDLEQKDGEDFDAATERARGALLTARSRIRKAVRGFPTGLPGDEVDL